jgi:serine phosphatase RsbU (regulator of sigma subunit)
VTIDKPRFTIGRRTAADLPVAGADVSRQHAEIERDGDVCVLRDAGSRWGTFVNGEPVTERTLAHGDRIRLGRGDAVELEFVAEGAPPSGLRDPVSDAADLRQMAAILNGLRALGSGRVLGEVLTLVMDSAIDVTGAERGFVMLANAQGELEFTIARAAGRVTLPGASFATSDKIPREVFLTGQSRMVADLMEGGLAAVHDGTLAMGIRQVLCVPLRVAPYAPEPAPHVEPRTIGVLYLDGRERRTLLSPATRSSLEAFATQAALAIESARLYAESAEKARLDRDLRIAAEIQRALLPEPRFTRPAFDLAAVAVACRTVGGDFFDYFELSGQRFGFALGDVSGKGPPAALLAAAVQANLAAQAVVAPDAAATMDQVNRALLRRTVEARFATMFYGVLSENGDVSYSNAGQEAPVVVGRDRIRSLDIGGPVLGLLSEARYDCDTVTLERGDLVVVCSDGVSEARGAGGTEFFGRDRLIAAVAGCHGQEPDAVLDTLLAAVRDFTGDAPPADDITVLVLRYRGRETSG